MSDNDKTTQAQLEEARHAKESARRDKQAAKSERDAAEAIKGEERTAQPNDFSIL